jgi:S-adenosylhomocysteine hydrolase
MNCQNINSQLLVELIRLKKILTHSDSFSNTSTSYEKLSKEDDINRQIDISYPSSNLTQQIDMEIIEMKLNTHGIKIEQKLNECENDYFRRATIQLEQINGKNL